MGGKTAVADSIILVGRLTSPISRVPAQPQVDDYDVGIATVKSAFSPFTVISTL